MEIGQRVEIASGELEGERGTVARNPDSGEVWDDGDAVWIEFDHIADQWYEVSLLKLI